MATYFWLGGDLYMDEDGSGTIKHASELRPEDISGARPDAQMAGYSVIPNTQSGSDPNYLRQAYGDVRQGADGQWYAPSATLNQMSGNNAGGLQGFLNGPGAVMLPAAILGGAAFAHMGATGGAAGGATGAADASWGVNARATDPWFTEPGFHAPVSGTPGSSMADFFRTINNGQAAQQAGTRTLAEIFGGLDAAGGGLGTGIGASLLEGGSGFLDGGGQAAGSVLSRLFGGGDSSGLGNADLVRALGTLGATGLGVLGSNAQQDAMADVSREWMQMGAPSRARYEASFQPGFDIFQADPAAQQAATSAADIAARGYSSTMGNPFDQPAAQGGIYRSVLGQVALPQLNTYRSQNLTGGQLGTNTAGTASLAGAGQSGDMYNSLGFGLGQLSQPATDIESLLKKIGGNGGVLGNNYRLTV